MIIGVDQSLRKTGVCMMRTDGSVFGFEAIIPDPKTRYSDFGRILYIRDQLLDMVVIGRDDVAIESPALGAKGNSLPVLTALYYTLCIGLIDRGYMPYVFSPCEVKKTAGKGNLDKIAMYDRLPSEVRKMVLEKGQYVRYDLTDAYWVAMTFLKAKRLK